MNFCGNCGTKLDDGINVCPNCNTQVAVAETKPVAKQDSSDFLYALLGFLWPVVGLILFLVFREDTPLRAKSALKGTIIGFVLSVVSCIVFFVVYFIILAFAFSTM